MRSDEGLAQHSWYRGGPAFPGPVLPCLWQACCCTRRCGVEWNHSTWTGGAARAGTLGSGSSEGVGKVRRETLKIVSTWQRIECRMGTPDDHHGELEKERPTVLDTGKGPKVAGDAVA